MAPRRLHVSYGRPSFTLLPYIREKVAHLVHGGNDFARAVRNFILIRVDTLQLEVNSGATISFEEQVMENSMDQALWAAAITVIWRTKTVYVLPELVGP